MNENLGKERKDVNEILDASLISSEIGEKSFRFISQRMPGEVKVRFIDSTPDPDEKDTVCGVIELLMDDRPFIVDSLRIALTSKGVHIETLVNKVLQVARDTQGHLHHSSGTDSQVEKTLEKGTEAFVRIEVDSQAFGHCDEFPGQGICSDDLLAELTEIMRELGGVVDDYQQMLGLNGSLKAHLSQQLENLKPAAASLPSGSERSTLEARLADSQEALDFLNWLEAEHFIFLGCQSYRYIHSPKGEGYFDPIDGSAYGLLRVSDHYDSLEPYNSRLSEPDKVLYFSRSATKSRHHRSVYADIIMVRQFDDEGKLLGEARLIGLYTSRVFNASSNQIPYIRKKVDYILEKSGYPVRGHSYKEVVQLLETYPREELFQADKDLLLEHMMTLMSHHEERDLQLFVRRDPYDRFLSALVFFPRDDLSTSVRMRLQSILKESFNAEEVDFAILVQENALARLHFTLRLNPENVPNCDLTELRQRLVEAARNWERAFYIAASEAFGSLKGRQLTRRYAHGFPTAYQETFTSLTALEDAVYLERVVDENSLEIHFFQKISDKPSTFRIKFYYRTRAKSLSDIVPMLENFGLMALRARTYLLKLSDDELIHIDEFEVQKAPGQLASHEEIPINQFQDNLRDAMIAVWVGEMESDLLNQLVIVAGLAWRKVVLLRAYAQYLKQIKFGYSQEYISEVLIQNREITKQLVELFEHFFNPDFCDDGTVSTDERIAAIKEAIKQVSTLDEDKLLGQYLMLIRATLRTNAFISPTPVYLSLKFSPERIPSIPKPVPMFEIFLYSPEVEGVHLRGGKVARGGLRWSDRREDYRTEVLGLVKAQQVKNSVIVPVGAKGGFVLKKVPPNLSRDEWFEYGRSCYKLFIRGILDVTDNIVDGKVVTPDRVIRRDEEDPYMVIAADKGTATFSDTANSVGEEYQFWLGDGFASGGSVGYDHKKMGITARGAWVSVKHLFRELGINVQTTPITVVGIGDMSGDVFGNGMLQSEAIQLVAAFNHLHIFVDPNPDPKTSYVERQRLFDLPRSGWDDYSADLISEGGGIFSRSAKQIPISSQMQDRFAISESVLTPTELIKAILQAPTDLLWNGGIGTYVKSVSENHRAVGDKANDDLRINGSELGARVVGEGGNLGLTQLGRVEYAQGGGLCNTDFIDNAGGVACSDQEVNIKILLNNLVAQDELKLDERNQILVEMTDLVADIVLEGNSRQVQAISVVLRQCAMRMEELRRFIHWLESTGRLDRRLEAIPKDDQLLTRKNAGEGLTRPELAVLLAYSKSLLKESLVQDAFTDDPLIEKQLESTLPVTISERFLPQLKTHKLKNELVATGIANRMVNMMGITFAKRMEDSTGASPGEIAKAWLIVLELFDIDRRWRAIEELNYVIEADLQQQILLRLVRLTRGCTRWVLRTFRGYTDSSEIMESIVEGAKEAEPLLPSLLRGERLDLYTERRDHYIKGNVPEDLAVEMAGIENLKMTLSMIQVAKNVQRSMSDVLDTYFLVEEKLQLFWFAGEVDKLEVDSHWQALAREALRDDLELQHRSLVIGILQLQGKDVEESISLWLDQQQHLVERWNTLVEEIKSTKGRDYPIFSVALRELLDLAQSVSKCEY